MVFIICAVHAIESNLSLIMFPHCQICDFSNGADVEWIDEQYVPYATYGSAWVGYDDKRSYSSKVTKGLIIIITCGYDLIWKIIAIVLLFLHSWSIS